MYLQVDIDISKLLQHHFKFGIFLSYKIEKKSNTPIGLEPITLTWQENFKGYMKLSI